MAQESGSKKGRVREQVSQQDKERAIKHSELMQRPRMEVMRTVKSAVDAILKEQKIVANVVVAFDMQDPVVPEGARRSDWSQRSGGAHGTPSGFYFDGTTYLIASCLTSTSHAARVLFHEVLGHHGLRGCFGRDLNSILNQIATMRKAEVDAKIREYGLRSVSPRDRRTAAEELLAELAERTPQLHVIQRAMAAVRTWLRTYVPAFENLELTDSEIIRSYILPAREWVMRGGRGSQSGSAAFSRHPGFSDAVDAAVKAGQLGEAGARGHIEIGTLPVALAFAGIPAGDLRTSAKVLQKVVFDHGVPSSMVKRIPELLETPVMVFRSATVTGRFVIITSEMVRSAPLIVAISPEQVTGGGMLNFVPSLYPRDDLQTIQRWLNVTKPGENLLRYLDKKQSPSWLGSTRLQLPGEFRTEKGLQVRNVATQESIVNQDVHSKGPRS